MSLRALREAQKNVAFRKEGRVGVFSYPDGVSLKGAMGYQGKALIAAYVYQRDSTYQLTYFLVDREGGLSACYEEPMGILPLLFTDPRRNPFVSVVPYHPDKELEVSIPLFGREGIPLPKGKRPFVGEFLGHCQDEAIFMHHDTGNAKQGDKFMRIAFKDGVIKGKKSFKTSLPKRNKVTLSDEGIQLLAKEGDGYLHRLVGLDGATLQQRHINMPDTYVWEAIALNFEKPSIILCEKDHKLALGHVLPDSAMQITILPDIGRLYNTWRPVKVGVNAYVVYFNFEAGNGWLTVVDGKLVQFFSSREGGGYQCMVTGQVIEMLAGRIAIAGVCGTVTNEYAVLCYPIEEGRKSPNAFYVINCTLPNS